MPETENTPNLEMRTCVTCGKTFYVNIDDEKMRAANGIDPRRECYDCLRARALLQEQDIQRNKNSEFNEIFNEGKKIYKSSFLIAAIISPLLLLWFFIPIIQMHEFMLHDAIFVIIGILITIYLWISYFRL